jgi:sugar O-acyltransferase (sialic acid O-acetyltransferase NeuD family)
MDEFKTIRVHDKRYSRLPAFHVNECSFHLSDGDARPIEDHVGSMTNGSNMNVVVFGSGEFASLVWYTLTHDSPYNVIGFTVDEAYLAERTHHSLPVVAFEKLQSVFPPSDVQLFLPIGNNHLRHQRYRDAKGMGYRLPTYVSSRAITWPDLQVGECSMIFEASVVQPFARIGIGVIVRGGCYISHHVTVGDFSFLAGHTVTGGRSRIGAGCFIGLGAVIRDHVTVADNCLIGAGAVVCANTAPDGQYVGVPAKLFANAPKRPQVASIE